MATMTDEELQRRYDDGATLQELANELDRSISHIHGRLTHTRAPGRPPRSDVTTEQIKQLHDEEGLSFKQIGRQLHISHTTASRRYRGLIG